MFEELSHLLQVSLLGQACDVDCAVLRVILLFRASYNKQTVKLQSVPNNKVFSLLKKNNWACHVTMLTHFTLVAAHRSCSPHQVRGEEKQIETSEFVQLKFSVQHLRSTTKR